MFVFTMPDLIPFFVDLFDNITLHMLTGFITSRGHQVLQRDFQRWPLDVNMG